MVSHWVKHKNNHLKYWRTVTITKQLRYKRMHSLENLYACSYWLMYLGSPVLGRVPTAAHGATMWACNSPSIPTWEIDYHTGDYTPYSLRTVGGFLNIPHDLHVQRLWDRAYRLLSSWRRLETLTVADVFSSKAALSPQYFYRPWVLMAWLGMNQRSSAGQAHACPIKL